MGRIVWSVDYPCEAHEVPDGIELFRVSALRSFMSKMALLERATGEVSIPRRAISRLKLRAVTTMHHASSP